MARLEMQALAQGAYPDAWLLFQPQSDDGSTLVALIKREQEIIPDDEIEDSSSVVPSGDDDTTQDGITTGIDDELLDGFDDFELGPSTSTKDLNRVFDFGGQLSMASAYSYDLNTDSNPGLEPYNGLSKAQTLLRLHSNIYFSGWRFHLGARGLYDWFYDLEGEDEFSSGVLDEHQSETDWHEVFLQGNITDNLYLKTGRQITSWGRSDNLRILDQLNPLDLREPGSTDIEDIRLPVNMTRISYLVGAWTMEGIAIHEIRFNKLPVAGSEFMQGNFPQFDEEIPDDDWAAEHAFNITGVFSGWDLSMHHARLYDDTAYLDLSNPEGPVFRHRRLHFSGMAFNRTFGSWLIKGEYARVENVLDSFLQAGTRSDIMLGFEYSGFINTQISAETSVQHLHEWRQPLVDTPFPRPRDFWQSAFRINRSFLNERLNLLLVALFQGKSLDEGHLVRFNIDYKPIDALTTSLGAVLYSGDNMSTIGRLADRDRILFGIKYHF